MIEDIYVNVNAGSISTSRVNSLTDPTNRAFSAFVGDDTRTFNIYFVDGSGSYIAPTTVKNLRVALGDIASTPYAETDVFVPIANGFQIIIPLTSTSLGDALTAGSNSIQTYFEIETTDFADSAQTVLQTQVDVTGQVISTSSGNDQVHQEAVIVACSDETTDLTTGTSKMTFRVPYNFYVQEVRASLTEASTGSSVIADVNDDGTSILSTEVSVDAGETTSQTASVLPVISSPLISDNSEVTIDIDQVGSTTAGKGLKVTLSGRRA
jgi:hypothetical protein